MTSLLDPVILFFLFGILAGAVRSNLEIPRDIAKFLSLYLLMAIGLKGGFELRSSGLTAEITVALSIAVLMAFVVPVMGYLLLRHWAGGFDAAAIAAAYGSVSAVTFVAAIQYLDGQSIAAGGYMAAALVLMESPAIILAVCLATWLRSHHAGPRPTDAVAPPTAARILKSAFTDGAHLLLLGAMGVGFISGEAGKVMMQPFTGDLFKGMLAFFLLDMGLMVARNWAAARQSSPVLIVYALLAPVLHATLALLLCRLLQVSPGDTVLLMVLSASASYIVVPAVLRYALPEAQASLYFGLSLGITFPFNIVVGIPLYTTMALTVMT